MHNEIAFLSIIVLFPRGLLFLFIYYYNVIIRLECLSKEIHVLDLDEMLVCDNMR